MPLFLQRREVAAAPPSPSGSLIEEEEELQDIQTKLVVNQPGDAFEQEADAVAQLAANPKSSRWNQSSPTASENEPLLQRKPVAPAPVHSSTQHGGALRPPDAGNPLSDTVRSRVEPVLGVDLASVRVHASPQARQTAGALAARAFTNRDHIWLGPGESQNDETLIAHELTHVVQQTAGGAPAIQRKPSNYGHPEDGSVPRERMQDEIDEELGDESPPEERPEIDRGEVSARKETLQPRARPEVDRPAEARPNVEAAAAETAQTVDAPAEADGKGEEKKEDAKGETKDAAALDAGAAAAQAAFGAASAETPPTVPPPVAAVEMVAPIDAGGRGLEPVPGADAAVAEIAEATQSMRDEGTGLQEIAAGERSNARILQGNVHLISQGIAQSDLGVSTSQTHATFRRSVVEQGRAALQVSREKTAMVAQEAPKYGEKADEGREDSEGMAEESGALSADSAANAPDDEEAAERANEQGGEINRAGADVGNLDRAFSGSQERSRGLAADAVQAAELNTQVETKITQSSEMLDRTNERLGQMRQQTNDARGQLDALSERPAEIIAQAGETEAEGRSMVEESQAVEERLRTEQATHRSNAAAIPAESPAEIAPREQEGEAGEEFSTESLPPVQPAPAMPEMVLPPADGDEGGDAGSGQGAPAPDSAPDGQQPPPQTPGSDEEPVPAAPPGGATGGGEVAVIQRQPQAGYEDRFNVDLASPISRHIPHLFGGTAPAEGEQVSTREEQETRERERRQQEIMDIQTMAGRPFEETTARERRWIAMRLMGRHLMSGLRAMKWPGWGTLAIGLINPITPLLGVVSGFSMVASGAANLFNAEAWRRDWVGNLLKTAADIATGLTIILGSVTALAAVIAALCTALIIFTFGFLAPALGPAVAFCASVMVTVGGWTIAVGKWALLLQFLCFLKNLYEAGVARNAAELQRTSDRMSSDVSGAANVVLQLGMAKLGQIGGRGLQTSMGRAGGAVRWAGGLTTRVGGTLRGAGRSVARGGNFARMAAAAGELAPQIRGVITRGVRSGRRSLWRGVTSMPSQALAGARALPGFIRSPISTLKRALGISREALIGEGVGIGRVGRLAAAREGQTLAQVEVITGLSTEAAMEAVGGLRGLQALSKLEETTLRRLLSDLPPARVVELAQTLPPAVLNRLAREMTAIEVDRVVTRLGPATVARMGEEGVSSAELTELANAAGRVVRPSSLRPTNAIHDLASTLKKHTINGSEARGLLRRGKSIHVFNEDANLAELEARVWTEGQAVGSAGIGQRSNWERYLWESPTPIGRRIQNGRADIPCHLVEIKYDPITKKYHLVPRITPAD